MAAFCPDPQKKEFCLGLKIWANFYELEFRPHAVIHLTYCVVKLQYVNISMCTSNNPALNSFFQNDKVAYKSETIKSMFLRIVDIMIGNTLD